MRLQILNLGLDCLIKFWPIISPLCLSHIKGSIISSSVHGTRRNKQSSVFAVWRIILPLEYFYVENRLCDVRVLSRCLGSPDNSPFRDIVASKDAILRELYLLVRTVVPLDTA